MENADYLVYEIVNFDASEIAVGVAPRSANAEILLAAEAGDHGWAAGDRVTFRVVEDELSQEAALAFSRRYGRSTALRPFRVVASRRAIEA